jgi:hypothetical protein
MSQEPRLVGPIFGSMAALILFVVGRYVVPEQYQAARILLIGAGGVSLLFALFGWADWLVYRFNVHVKDGRLAWYGPWEYYRDTAREIRLMDPTQLRLFQHIGPLEVHGYFKNRSIYFVLHTSTINIPWTWIGDYLSRCGAQWPDLVPQYGTSGGSIERDYIQAFTREMVAAELASPPVGNRPATWKVPFSEVINLFGLGDG